MNDKYHLSLLKLKSGSFREFKETTFLFLLDGELSLTFEDHEYHLLAGDLLVFNPNDHVQVTEPTSNQYSLFELAIDNLYFTSLYAQYFVTKFECYPKQVENGKREAIYNLRKHLAELLLAHYSVDSLKDLKVTMTLNQLLLLLIQFFQKEDSYYNYQTSNEKIREAMAYIADNYQQPLSLEQVSSQFYMSTSALSKLFKLETGQYFSHYLSTLRIRQSLKELLYTRMSIDEVALNNGFSNSKTYRQQFKKQFLTSPSDYRLSFFEKQAAQKEKPLALETNLKENSNNLLSTLYYYAHLPNEETATAEVAETHKKLAIITQDVREQINADMIIHVGTLEDLLNINTLNEIIVAKEKLSIKYIGIQQLFDEAPTSYGLYQRENLSIISPFGKFDTILTFLEKYDLGIYYQISLTTYESFSSFHKSDRQQFLKHIEKKMGTAFLKKWKISCLFDQQNFARNSQVFNEIYEICQQINPAIQLGASLPLSYPDYDFKSDYFKERYLKEVVPRCEFLSYCSEPNRTYDLVEKERLNLELFQSYVFKEITQLKNRLAQWRIDLPIYLSEWNTLTGNSRVTNGTFFRGAMIIQETLKLDLVVAGYGFWLNTELYEKHQEATPIQYDGLELFHNFTGKRPAFHALELANRLKGKVVALGEEFMLTQHHDNYQLLLWNTNYFAPHLSLEESFLKSQSVTFRIDIPEIVDNLYQVKQLEFNRHHGAIFYAYEDFKSSEALDFESHTHIAETSRPKMKVFDLDVKDGFSFYSILDTNAILLLELNAIKFLE